MLYYAKIVKKEGNHLVSFPDLPNINTYGETLLKAKQNAKEAVSGTLESDFERGFPLPKAKKYIGKNFYPIIL